ncbi:phage tail domain-containing protein [Abyssicoccus albus]|uniref:phage tail domain-containing protein n=1 Tax=Abyssicoccus albus TaxID=1817405 RepID=UPI00097E2FE6|nr:phage tail domain-containing protein [Abyssicoccus albus]AQL56413.1 hypothetical protein BVH56_05505 [Abyssicoccus albus]
MFRIYDLNYNEVELPVDRLGFGFKALDINISPIKYESIYSESSYADQLHKRYPKDREVSINVLNTSYNTRDWRLKRDKMYSFLRNLGAFYIAEEYQPYKLLKVIVDESYELERPTITWQMGEIPLKILDSPFKKSLHKTLDIDKEGVLHNGKWAYGMGLSHNSSDWQYSFTNESIRFLNAGTESIKMIRQQESEVTLSIGSNATYVEIYDGKNLFRLNKAVNKGDTLVLRGRHFYLNGQNCLEDTNATFLEIHQGWNDWEVRNVSSYEIKIDFRFLYD